MGRARARVDAARRHGVPCPRCSDIPGSPCPLGPALPAYLDFVDSIWDGEGLFDSNGRSGLSFDVDKLMRTTALCGSPAEIIDRLGEARDMLGLDVAGLSMDLGGLPETALFEAIDLVGADIIPELALTTVGAVA